MEELTEALRLPPALCAVLAVRGFGVVDDAKRFLRPLVDHLHDPADLADGEVAARRIARAVRAGERILVHGDYDVDGICATALFTRFLRNVGADVVPFVPHRLRDGYDFGDAGLKTAQEAGAKLIVTADCGTVAAEPIGRAMAAGLDVVVTDHHTVGPDPSPASALVNPQRPDCAYPEKGLCGTGLVFKVAELVSRELGVGTEELHGLLDLVALATVADLVPLQGENRVLVRHGLTRFARSRVVGLNALLSVARVDPATIHAGQLGFVVAPRINAVGRMGDSADALRLLLTEDHAEAEALARRLDDTNRVRQDEDRRTLDEALELLARDFDPDRDFGVVLASEGWHPGVIGIVASRVVERIHRPTVLIALEGEQGRGSARSVPGFHLYDALSACRGHMGRFGGHRQAAGMDVARDSVAALRKAFNEEASRRLSPEDLRPVLRPDGEVALREIDLELVHWLGYLGPHGIGNARPLFLARGVQIEGARRLKDVHLKASLRDGGATLDAIGFGLAVSHPPESLHAGFFDVLVKLERNEWRGVARPQAQILDLRPSGSGLP
ncbi:MAG TPA: single-stranded-DNA-specific exonuclease RecJ [Longimicrobiales bacterium]|nr:single-stranded-DNA-specific exonuclease RecJ [Longimicrobiales bacterium]